jgi:hypothetical protein
VNFRANGTAETFLEETHYYAFGMQMEGIGAAAVTRTSAATTGKGALLKVVSFIFALPLDHFIRQQLGLYKIRTAALTNSGQPLSSIVRLQKPTQH